MKPLKVILIISGIALNILVSYVGVMNQVKKKELIQSGKIVEADIIDLYCGRRDHIKFSVNGSVISKRIYLTSDECAILRKQRRIKLRVDEHQNIAFATIRYNDSQDKEIAAFIILGVFGVFCIYYFYIKPEISKSKTTQNSV